MYELYDNKIIHWHVILLHFYKANFYEYAIVVMLSNKNFEVIGMIDRLASVLKVDYRRVRRR